MENLEGIISIISIFGVLPISIGGMITYYKLKSQQLKQGKILTPQEIEAVQALIKENEALRKRIENVELIMHESKLLSNEGNKK
jgi:hypothetical protein